MPIKMTNIAPGSHCYYSNFLLPAHRFSQQVIVQILSRGQRCHLTESDPPAPQAQGATSRKCRFPRHQECGENCGVICQRNRSLFGNTYVRPLKFIKNTQFFLFFLFLYFFFLLPRCGINGTREFIRGFFALKTEPNQNKTRRQIPESYLLTDNIWTEIIASLLIPPLFMNVSGQCWGVDSSPHRHCLSFNGHVFCANQMPAHGQASASQKKKTTIFQPV